MRVTWSITAVQAYEDIIDFIAETWTEDTALKFQEEVVQLTQRLSKYQHLCPQAKSRPDLRMCVITKQTSLVYVIREEVIEIVDLIDNRSGHRY